MAMSSRVSTIRDVSRDEAPRALGGDPTTAVRADEDAPRAEAEGGTEEVR